MMSGNGESAGSGQIRRLRIGVQQCRRKQIIQMIGDEKLLKQKLEIRPSLQPTQSYFENQFICKEAAFAPLPSVAHRDACLF